MLVRWIFRAWIQTALWFRFRRIQWVFHAPVPLDGSALIAGNHQNAILDSMTLASSSPRVPFTLSRASLFNRRWGRAFFEALRMIPIYRFRDGFGKMRKNAGVFQQFVDVLRRDQWLLIFPEGNQELRYTLRRLQKGIARITFAAQEAEGWERELPIIPVGIQYESHTDFGARLLIQFGRPISSLAFREVFARNPKEAERGLTAEVFEALKPLLILPPTDEEGYEAALQRWIPNKGRFPDLMDQFRSDQEIVAGTASAPESPRAGLVLLRRLAGYALSLPGLVLHSPPMVGALGLVRAFVKDPDLVPALRFLAGMFLVPIWYLVALGTWYVQTGSFSLGLLLLAVMPFSLWLWSRSWHWTR